ncbi:hypothetical protein SH501x_002758 [Pirellulaceae bacterium SH501]
MSTPSLIQVGLDNPVDHVVGHSWPESDGIPLEFTAADDDRTLNIDFPSGRKWTTQSNITFLSQKDGQVASIVATPLNEASDFSNALAHFRKTTNELEISEDILVNQRLGEWLTKPPSWSPFGTKSVGCQLEPGITFFAEIKPANEDNKWYLSYHFTVDRFFADGTKAPASPAEEHADR